MWATVDKATCQLILLVTQLLIHQGREKKGRRRIIDLIDWAKYVDYNDQNWALPWHHYSNAQTRSSMCEVSLSVLGYPQYPLLLITLWEACHCMFCSVLSSWALFSHPSCEACSHYPTLGPLNLLGTPVASRLWAILFGNTILLIGSLCSQLQFCLPS